MRRDAVRGPRRRQIGDAAGDPLDGLVNLFDVGIVLAVAFLLAGLASQVSTGGRLEPRPTAAASDEQTDQGRTVPNPSRSDAPPVEGRGQAVGTVYRLDDGRLIYTDDPSATTP